MRLLARFDAAACPSATAANPIREGTVALGLESIDPSPALAEDFP